MRVEGGWRKPPSCSRSIRRRSTGWRRCHEQPHRRAAVPLLPAVYRLRDAEQGEPLRALLALFAQQFAALEENLEQLYDDQFIETCADWVAPYIGDLIGYRPLHGVVAEGRLAARRGRQHDRATAAARAPR